MKKSISKQKMIKRIQDAIMLYIDLAATSYGELCYKKQNKKHYDRSFRYYGTCLSKAQNLSILFMNYDDGEQVPILETLKAIDIRIQELVSSKYNYAYFKAKDSVE